MRNSSLIKQPESTQAIEFNVTQLMLTEVIVPRIIDLRFSHLKSEINVANVVKALLSISTIPQLFAEDKREVNRLKVEFQRDYMFAVRRIVIKYLTSYANTIEHRVSNSIVTITSKDRQNIIRKKANSGRNSSRVRRVQSNYVVSQSNFGGVAS